MQRPHPRTPPPLRRRDFLKYTVLLLSTPTALNATVTTQDSTGTKFPFDPEKPLIAAPPDAAHWPEFRRKLAAWRQQRRTELQYSDALYHKPEFSWVTSNFACCFLMMGDLAFYDPRQGRYTAASFLRRARQEFGGFDSVVWWHAYPRIGLDDRNQFDFYRDMPGGLAGLRTLAREFHRNGVRVFIDYNPWDLNTRREATDDLEALAGIVHAVDADGIFLDTLDRGAETFRTRLDAARPGVILEGEIALPLERLHDHHQSWAQWFGDAVVPGVLRNKWIERRHLQHQIDRWSPDHSVELHQAWMNGSGMMVWENVFGSWIGWNRRDQSILRSMLPIQRRYADLFCGEAWTPLVPTLNSSVFASLWEAHGHRLWTLIHRNNATIRGPLFEIPTTPSARIFDLIHGVEVPASEVAATMRTISGELAPRGIACFLELPAGVVTTEFKRFLKRQAVESARASQDITFPQIHAKRRPAPRLSPRVPADLPRGMVIIPGCDQDIVTEFRNRECGFLESTAQEFLGGWKIALHGSSSIRRRVSTPAFAMDTTPVTNAEFSLFLKSSGYRPRHSEKFLVHWKSDAPPAELRDHPVVFVDLDDARAYARWAGKRLPTDEEWQIAAQGPEAFKYPWGNTWETGRCNGGESRSTTHVRAFPEGRTPSGLYDLCGNVWHWTESEHDDGRTRFSLIRGGSFYRHGGSAWYFDEGPQPANFAAKILLMWPGLDRCANIGFRCVCDVAPERVRHQP